MLAAMKCERNSIGIEIDEEYWALAADRLRNQTESLFSSSKLEFCRPDADDEEFSRTSYTAV